MKDTVDNNRPPEDIERDIERTRAEMSSTIDAIQSKLTPGQIMDQAISYARTSLPADFGSNLSNTVRENPVPVALIGIGIAWLMKSGQQPHGQTRVRRTSSVSHIDDDLYPTRSSAGYSYDSSLHDSSDTDHEGRMRHATSKVSEKSHDLKNRISEKSHDLKSRMSEKGQDLRGRARGTADSISHRAGDLSHRSQEQYYRAKDSLGRMLEEQPLVVGALGIAVGAALGAALPATAREDELMGDKRDNLLDSAKQKAQEQAGKAKEKAQQALSEAEKKMQEQKDGQATESSAQGKNDDLGGDQYPSGSSSAGALDEKRGQQSLH